jgi:antitoxin component YwqK of YwqJK toxin-antitoxin module
MRTASVILFLSIFSQSYSQQDTVIDKKHYNTILYYPYFDFKCNDTVRDHYIIGVGNVIDSAKTGLWTYFYPDGNILATGNYINGRKRGRWEYNNSFTVLIWDRSAQARDFIRYNYETGAAEIVDVVNTRFVQYKMINGHDEPPPHVGIRFL